MNSFKSFLLENKDTYELSIYATSTFNVKYGEYFAKFNLGLGKVVIFTNEGILYKDSPNPDEFMKYKDIDKMISFSNKKGTIFSKNTSNHMHLEGVNLFLLGALVNKVLIINSEKIEKKASTAINDCKRSEKTKCISKIDDNVKIKWNSKIDDNVKKLIKLNDSLELLKKENYFKDLKNEIDEKIENVNKYISKVKNPLYQIAIVGAIKAGKSSLINALLDEDIVSVDVTPETATLTKFRYSNINFLNVKFYSSKEWQKIWTEIDLEQDKDQGEKYLSEYKDLRAEEIKFKYLDKENLYLEFKNIEDIKKEVEKWTSSKHREHFFVKELEIGLNKLNLPEQVCLVDTPGLNDISKYRSNITKRYVESANAVLICINCKTLRNEEYIVINQIFNAKNKFKDKIYILGTQKDILEKGQWLNQEKDWIKNLKINFENNEKATKEHILAVSSYVSRSLKSLEEGKIDMDLRSLLGKCQITSIDESYYLTDLERGKTKYERRIIENIVKNANLFSNIEYLKNIIIEKKLLANWNNELIKKFEIDYELILDEIMNFVKKNTKDINNNIELVHLKNFNKQKKLNESVKTLKNLSEQRNNLNKEIEKIEKEFNTNIKDFKEQLTKLNKETFK